VRIDGTSFLRDKVREGSRLAARVYQIKQSDFQSNDEGVFHGATPPDQTLSSQYRDNSIDNAFETNRQLGDVSDAPQPGVLHGLLGRWAREGVQTPIRIDAPLITTIG
jgi:hypothetical protein